MDKDNFLAKWLSGELKGPELEAFENSADFATYKRIAEASKALVPPEFSVDNSLSDLKDRRDVIRLKATPLHPFRNFLKIAAVVAVLLAGAYVFMNLGREQVTAHLAEHKTVTLPDSSSVWLNSESEITYNGKAWDKKRKVSLKGEAFFMVAKGKRFIVETDFGPVSVLGTQFNVENRPGFFEVTCFEGRVSVVYQGKETLVTAGSSYMVIDGNVRETSVPEGLQRPGWLSEESSFKSIPLKFVLDELARHYSMDVQTKGVDLDQLFTGTISNMDFELALKSISVPSRISYTFEGNKVVFHAQNTP